VLVGIRLDRGGESQVVEQGGAQIVDDAMDLLLRLPQQALSPPHLRRIHVHAVERQLDHGQQLGDLVVQLAGEAAALLLRGVQQAADEDLALPVLHDRALPEVGPVK
jgi:hypothetical protein